MLGEARDASRTAPVQGRAVALALWVLRPHVPAYWLKAFWDGAGGDEAIGRSQSCNAAFNGIERRLRERHSIDI